jgi:hypothetical protein
LAEVLFKSVGCSSVHVNAVTVTLQGFPEKLTGDRVII